MCFADCIVTDFDGFRMAYVGGGGTLALTRAVFDTNNLFADNYGAAVVESDASGGSTVRLQESTFKGKPPEDLLPRLLADNRGSSDVATFYSDAEDPLVCAYEGAEQAAPPPQCVDTAPKSLESLEAGEFLSASSAWLIATQEVLLCIALLLIGVSYQRRSLRQVMQFVDRFRNSGTEFWAPGHRDRQRNVLAAELSCGLPGTLNS